MLFPGASEWLYSDHCAMPRFRWTDVKCCPGSCPSPREGDCPSDVSSNIRHARDPEIHGRTVSLTSLNHPTSDGDDDATSSSFQEARKDGDPTCTSILKHSKGEDVCICTEAAKPNCGGGGEYVGDNSRCLTKHVSPWTLPFEPTPKVASRVEEHLDWQEEKKQWVRAAGVNTPAELECKIAGMCRAAGQNLAELKKLTAHVTEVKSFLLQLHEMDQYIAKRKKRCERSTRKRKRSRRACAAVDWCCAVPNTQDSSTERATEQGGGPLLDPEIMNSFRFLIKTSA